MSEPNDVPRDMIDVALHHVATENARLRERIRTLEARYQKEYAAHQRTLVVGREEIERLHAENGRLTGIIQETYTSAEEDHRRLFEVLAETERLREENKRLYSANEEAQTQRVRESHANTDLARANRALIHPRDAAQARVRELEAALGHLLGELSDIQIEAVREGCGNTNAACLRRRVDEARAALTEPTPPAGGQG